MNATRVVDVPVEVASHTGRLASASVAFREILRHIPVRPPTADTRLLSGIDGAAVINVEAGLDKLAVQISQTVQWADCLQACMEAGATAFLELGPGRALSQMVAGAYPDVATRSLDEFRTLQGARAWLASHASR
jgi:[acyl-carrier-protein] S-malonyltransferase